MYTPPEARRARGPVREEEELPAEAGEGSQGALCGRAPAASGAASRAHYIQVPDGAAPQPRHSAGVMGVGVLPPRLPSSATLASGFLPLEEAASDAAPHHAARREIPQRR